MRRLLVLLFLLASVHCYYIYINNNCPERGEVEVTRLNDSSTITTYNLEPNQTVTLGPYDQMDKVLVKGSDAAAKFTRGSFLLDWSLLATEYTLTAHGLFMPPDNTKLKPRGLLNLYPTLNCNALNSCYKSGVAGASQSVNATALFTSDYDLTLCATA